MLTVIIGQQKKISVYYFFEDVRLEVRFDYIFRDIR